MFLTDFPNLAALLGVIAVASVASLVVQAAIEQPAMVAIGIGGWVTARLLSMVGANGAFLILAVAVFTVTALMLRFAFRHVTQPRAWVPMVGIIVAGTGSAAILK